MWRETRRGDKAWGCVWGVGNLISRHIIAQYPAHLPPGVYTRQANIRFYACLRDWHRHLHVFQFGN